ncbi:MAG TPA: septum formation initiator family protein [Chitinophagales bacterium]|nr:septum formation initiator family protein [Chitinophagales bacterium]
MAKSSKKKNFFRRLRKRKIPSWMRNKYVITITAFLVWMLFLDRNDIISQVQLRLKLSDLRDKKSYYQQQIAEVKKEKQELLTNQDSLEKFAREKYMMKKDNEDLFVIVPEKKK